MGRRSRKRSAAAQQRADASTPPGVAPPGERRAREPGPRGRRSAPSTTAAKPRTPPPPPTHRARLQDAPPAPWSPFPLVELTILIGLVLLVLGFLGIADQRALFLICGIALVYLATIELSLREHFTGYRSHSTLLAGVAGVLSAVPLYFLTSVPYEIIGVVGLLVFGGSFLALRAAFRRRTGGIGFRA